MLLLLLLPAAPPEPPLPPLAPDARSVFSSAFSALSLSSRWRLQRWSSSFSTSRADAEAVTRSASREPMDGVVLSKESEHKGVHTQFSRRAVTDTERGSTPPGRRAHVCVELMRGERFRSPENEIQTTLWPHSAENGLPADVFQSTQRRLAEAASRVASWRTPRHALCYMVTAP